MIGEYSSYKTCVFLSRGETQLSVWIFLAVPTPSNLECLLLLPRSFWLLFYPK